MDWVNWGLLRSTVIVKIAIIAVVYAGLTIAIHPLSYGPLQVRISDALLTIPFIPYFGIYGAVGLALGCVLSNIVSPLGPIDILFGFITNLVCGLEAWITYRVVKNILIGKLLMVSLQITTVTVIIGYILLHLIFDIPLILSILGVFIGSVISIGVLGFTLITLLQRIKWLWMKQ